MTAWELAGGRGVIVLPTGSGKTRVAVAALARLERPALCLVPTRVLLWQWVKELAEWHRGPIGCFGDGQHRIEPITVCTFESAMRHGAWSSAGPPAPSNELRLARRVLDRQYTDRTEAVVPPQRIRQALFVARTEVGTRATAIARVARELGLSAASVDDLLLADLPGQPRLVAIHVPRRPAR